MRERIWIWFTWFSFFMIVPYLITCIVNGTETALLNRKFNIENSVPMFLSKQIPDSYEMAAIEAQAVIARTNLYYELKEKDFFSVLEEYYNVNISEYEKNWIDYVGKGISNYIDGFVKKSDKKYSYPHNIYKEAVLNTKNMVLKHEDMVKLAPYHFCSGGSTRNGEEAFRSKEYEYLTAVDSGFDKEAKEYISITYFTEEDLSENIEIEERDQAGYVLSLRVNNKILEGESFRQGMQLPSSNFSINKINDKYQIISRGIGHGVGFSQYGGNELAKRGKKWREILDIYFPDMELSGIL